MQKEVTELWGKLVCSEACLDAICGRISNICVRDVKSTLHDIAYKHIPAFDIVVGEEVTLFYAVEWSNATLVNVGQLNISLSSVSVELQNEVAEVVSKARTSPELFNNLNDIARSDLDKSVRESVIQRASELKGFQHLDLDLCNQLKEEFFKRLLSFVLYKFSKSETHSPRVIAGVLLCTLRSLLRKEQSHDKHSVFYSVSRTYIKTLTESLNDASLELNLQ